MTAEETRIPRTETAPKVVATRRKTVVAVRHFFAIVLLGTLSGCCTFSHDWKEARSYAYPNDEIAGCWEGTWHSEAKGRERKVQAIITKQGQNYYQARIKAKLANLLPYEFEMPLVVAEDGRSYRFSGSANRGWLAGGEFLFSGDASSFDFNSTFISDTDHGTFSMQRIMTSPQQAEESYRETTLASFESWD